MKTKIIKISVLLFLAPAFVSTAEAQKCIKQRGGEVHCNEKKTKLPASMFLVICYDGPGCEGSGMLTTVFRASEMRCGSMASAHPKLKAASCVNGR